MARHIASATVPFAVGAVLTVIAFLLLRDTFPERMATHFSLDGTADGFSSPPAALGQYLLLFGIEAVGGLAVAFSVRPGRRGPRPLGVFCSALAAATVYLLVATMYASSGLEDGADARLPAYQLAVAAGVGVGTGLLGRWVTRRRT
ncbi:DUF1648 domain-containing protein [Streptomyces sp. TRM 70361]|uniref:DUF1648 domain-containing protein n=1 Tax=Streptomyces sp. TRM 70361 TaxID=3116553 RepID=UPI002E7BBF4D|nr:DUF1648 domain-containing protein [Streptomyces sp. TRM 70361]MEE1942653.1 DUF1648 domain-containing protein [Streptomyces sp. TRM 70361]